ncbi:MAG TPA: LysR substrate-binding domain-containing protein [Novosphingobium sp.]|nr:LysR substrate-binding domain-containing protein [Novosphingobium sp.]
MRFRGLDLNLLVALDILLEERSVIRASERLSLSQPATSAALSRLRDFFQDELLIVQNKRMFATSYAERLWPEVKACLQVADRLVNTSLHFDPATSRRLFTIVASDYVIAAIFTRLCAEIAHIAPRVEFDFRGPDQDTARKLNAGEIDLFVTPADYAIGEQPVELLFEERHVVAGCAKNRFFDGPITEESVFARGHIGVTMGTNRTAAFADRHLALLKKPRRVEISVPVFTMVPRLLVGTDRLAIMHERLAQVMAQEAAIAMAPLPFDFPVMREVLQFHRTRDADEGLRWLIELLKTFARYGALAPPDGFAL